MTQIVANMTRLDSACIIAKVMIDSDLLVL